MWKCRYIQNKHKKPTNISNTYGIHVSEEMIQARESVNNGTK